MWAAVFGVALMGVLNPLRLSAILLVISRPRPIQNLFAFWIGAMTIALPAVLIPILVLHDIQLVASYVHELATSPMVRRIQLGLGILLLAGVALMVVRIAAQQRKHAPALVASQTGALPAAPSAADEPASRRLRGRAREAWERGSPWVAAGVGFISAPAPDAVLMVLAVILTSGAALGIQVTAGIAYVFAMLAVAELALVAYLVTPAKTEGALRRVHDWALTHRRQVVTAVLALVGLGLTAAGMGIA
jgi:hypothetical protein